MTNYVTLVNQALEEAGVDLASFASDGSDFTSTSVDPLMRKMKTWVQRAWRDIQQDSPDWQFMSSTAEINLDPGILFYNNNPTGAALLEEVPPGCALSFYDIQDSDSTTFGTGNDPNYTVYVKELRPIGLASTNGKYWGSCLFYKRPQYLWEDYFVSNYEYPPDSDVANLFIKPNSYAGYFDGYAKFRIEGEITGDSSGIALDSFNNDFSADPTNATVVVPQIMEYVFFEDLVNGDDLFAIPGAKITKFLITPGSPNDTLLVEFTCPISGTAYTKFSNNTGTGKVIDYSLVLDGAVTIAAHVSDITLVEDNIYATPIMVHSWISYNFDEENMSNDFVGDIDEINNSTFRISELQGTAPTSERKLEFIPWETFKNKYDFENIPTMSWPQLITEDNTGRWRFYPPLNQRVTLSFDYQRDPQILSAYNDVPTGLDDYFTDLIVWRALMYYGEYDEQPTVVARAYKNYKTLLIKFEMRYREKGHFKPRRLY